MSQPLISQQPAVIAPSVASRAFPKRRHWIWALIRNQTAVVSGVAVIAIGIITLLSPVLALHSPLQLDVTHKLAAPSISYPMGTDQFGRDVSARILYGGRLSMVIGLSVTALSTLMGLVLGLASGYYRRLDNPIMRVMDALMAFPSILFAIVIMGVLGPKTINVIIALTIVSAPRIARVVRGAVLVAREEVYVEAARAAGARDTRIIARHVLPNIVSPIIMQASYTFASAILAEAALSFIGVGAPPQVPTLGNILSEGRLVVSQAPWITIFPGVAIVVIVLGANLFGDGLRDALDPRMRGE